MGSPHQNIQRASLVQIYYGTSLTTVFLFFFTKYECEKATKSFLTSVLHHIVKGLEGKYGEIQHNVVFKGLVRSSGLESPIACIYFPPSVYANPLHSTRLLWQGCSLGTPNTVCKLKHAQPPAFQRGKKETEREKKRRKQPCPACIFLSL